MLLKARGKDMKKRIIQIIFSLTVLIALIYGLINKVEILYGLLIEDTQGDDSALMYQVEVNELSGEKTNYFYYNILNDDQKKMYCTILANIKDYTEKIYLDVASELDTNKIASDVSKAMEAVLADYPEIFYIDPLYEITVNNVVGAKVLLLKLDYTMSSNEINKATEQIDKEIDKIIAENISGNMNEYEKELSIHDYLATNIIYFEYTNIREIPTAKHGIHDAIIGKSAVCDGISKAYQVILNRLGIESIVVSGDLDGESHAWNIVKIDDEYYHVDITSDKSLMKNGNQNLLIHAYFNLSTEEMEKTHSIDNRNVLPTCIYGKYNYYSRNDYIVEYLDSFSYKLGNIINKQSGKALLEFKTQGISDVPQKLAETLYNTNFNNYKTNGITKVQYTNINDVYIVVK